MTRPEISHDQSRGRAVAIARILDNKKIRDVCVLDVAGICSFTDFFVIATAENSTQLKAAQSAVYSEMRDHGVRGRRDQVQYDTTWAVIDYGDVVTHLFLPESRDYYRLENLWGDGESVSWEGGGATIVESIAPSHSGDDEFDDADDSEPELAAFESELEPEFEPELSSDEEE